MGKQRNRKPNSQNSDTVVHENIRNSCKRKTDEEMDGTEYGNSLLKIRIHNRTAETSQNLRYSESD